MATNKRLYRSRTDSQVAGVAAGLADYFETDPTMIRALFVILTLLGGPGILLYIILWVIMPEEPAANVTVKRKRKREEVYYNESDDQAVV
jgi:phage shock protein C